MKKSIDVIFAVYEIGGVRPRYFFGATEVGQEKWKEIEAEKGKWWL
jgi:hypothetical protein